MAGPINTLDKTFADACVRHLGIAQEVETEKLGTITLVGQPISMSRTGQQMVFGAPEYGRHTDEVLGEFGYGADEISGFRISGVV